MNPALELAVARARQDASTPGAPPPPMALRPVLRFTRLPTRALRTVRQVLDRDEAFRAHVSEGATEADLGRASWLFLDRPDGWADELALLQEAATEEEADASASRREQTAERRLAQVEESVERLRVEARDAQQNAARAEQALATERAARLQAEREHGELVIRADALESERSRAIRNLKDSEALAATRLEELRATRERLDLAEARVAELETAVQLQMELGDSIAAATTVDPVHAVEPVPVPVPPPPPVVPSPWAGADPEMVATAVHRAAEAAAVLGAALSDAARSLQRAVPPAPIGTEGAAVEPGAGLTGVELNDAGVDGDNAGASRVRPPRRTPIRLRRGAHDGSPEGVEQLLATPDVVVVVDGYNVSMEAWPLLESGPQRTSLISMLGALQSRTGASIHVVFDGDDDGRRPSVGAPLPVRVHFSHADVEADDVILDMVARLPTDQPVVVVSSDRRVQDGARRLGANVVRSCELLALTRG